MAMLSLLQETIPEEEIRRELERVIRGRRFSGARRSIRFLRYVVEAWLEGKGHELKELVIADDVYGRLPDYDPKIDSVVRVEAARLRARLRSYYENEGKWNRIRITIPKGSYIPRFEYCSPAPVGTAAGHVPARNDYWSAYGNWRLTSTYERA